MEQGFTVREWWVESAKGALYGQIYIPERKERCPLVIFSHELFQTYRSGIPYAERLAALGYAVYLFDLRNTSPDSRSGTELTEMSVMTNAEDLYAVMQAAGTWDFVQPGRLALIGASQGGFASAAVAAAHPKEVTALVLLYPALGIQRDADRYPSREEIPETFRFHGWFTAGRAYLADLWGYDPYKEMEKYPGPVLLLHGTKDPIMSVSYSEQAAAHFPNARLHLIQNGFHGFWDACLEEAADEIAAFLQKHYPAAAAAAEMEKQA